MTKSISKDLLIELDQINSTTDGILDLINLVDKAIELSTSENPDRRVNVCLNNLVQTREKELYFLKVANDIDKQNRFDDAISAFRTDLTMWCSE